MGTIKYTKMKFAIKLILSLITIGMVLSTNTMRSRAQDSGSGSWDNGYKCPKIFLTEGKGSAVNQGEATIQAKTIVDPNNDATRLGLNLEFTKAPAADSIIAKIGNKISDKVYQIPYRFMSGDMMYNNPVRDNKTLIGSFVADNKKTYTMKILLPYKTFGWYISDDQANKMRVQINERGVAAKGNVSLNKSVIATNAELYLQKKALLDSASKDKAALDAELAKQKKESEEIDAQLADLKAKIEEAKKAVFQKQNALQTAVKSLNAANSAVTATSTQMNNIDLAINSLKEPSDSQMKKLKKNLDEITTIVNASYATLNKEISSKVADLNNSKAGFMASDNAKFEKGLDSSYPSS